MRIGSLVEFKDNTDIDSAFAQLRNMGMESCQLVCWQQSAMDSQHAKQIKTAADKHKIFITAFWCGWEGPCVWDFYDGQHTLGLVPKAYRFERLKTLLHGIDFAASLGIRDVVTHIGFIPENPYDENYSSVLVCVKELVKKCKENGQNFLFETGQETPVTLKRAIQDVQNALGEGNIGINLDPANLILYGKGNPVDALDTFGEFVMGIHAKDGFYPTDGHNLGKEAALGQGKVNYPAFIARLKEIGYSGDLTIEREITGEQQKKDILQAKELLEKLLQG